MNVTEETEFSSAFIIPAGLRRFFSLHDGSWNYLVMGYNDGA